MAAPSEKSAKYRAPALAKGLEILELLVEERGALPLTEICERLAKSRNEIFRMIHVLEQKQYICRDSTETGFELTNKLFALGMRQPRVRDLVAVAQPEMAALALLTAQSCHLAVAADDRMSIILRAPSPYPVSFSVRSGYTGPLAETTSGKTLFAFQSPTVRGEWLTLLKSAGQVTDQIAFLAEIDAIAAAGYARRESEFVPGVIDISAPVLDRGIAVAALAVPFVHMRVERRSIEETTVALLDAAQRICDELTAAI